MICTAYSLWCGEASALKTQGSQHERCTGDTEQEDGNHDTMRVRMNDLDDNGDDGVGGSGGKMEWGNTCEQ